MFTRCPHCDTQQPVTTQRIRDSRGLLNCAACGQSFDALASLSEQVDARPQLQDYHPFRVQNDHQNPVVWPWQLTGLFLMLVLFAQIAYFEGDRLTAQPFIHAALTKICLALDCQIPVNCNPDDWALSHSNLQSHLDQRYLLTSALTNQAEMAQAFPLLKLTLTDFKGRPLAERILEPQHYATQTILAAKQTVAIRLPIILPGHEIGGFSLNLM